MKLKLRADKAAILVTGALLAAPASAQQAAPAATNTQATPDVVGPAQLKDFSLNGTVTRRADTPAATAPAATRTPTRSAETSSPSPSPAPAAQDRRATRTPSFAPRQAPEPVRQQRQAPTQRDPFDFAPPTPARDASAGFSAPAITPMATAPLDSYSPAVEDSGGGFLKWLPWLAALIAAAGAAIWYFRRERSGGYALAGAGGNASAFDAGPMPAPPRPAPAPRAPVPTPAPTPPAAPEAPVGIISTRLRPSLELEFVPTRAVVNDEGATVEFDIAVFNSGSAPARNLTIEAALFNAGTDQDQAIAAFFTNPTAKGEPIPALPPLQRMTFTHSVSMTRDQMRLFKADDRSVFIPVIAFNSLFQWSGGPGQTSTSYIVGRDGNGDKLAPFRADLGARAFRDVAAREHNVSVRK